ncbi:MATE family efflux transporter [Mesoplasma syrphidae]|uniref:MATE family efflux transporter n=1 Tax=Mesoplasma syrphidae TaxID=225999 RepID=A0A2K9CC70_9MOLU|nr:MATE family efflux transporter [Mesoplasma syrphidae]AUF83234.1 MATE family efflux transporter [Mesoplasma syrphidae]
MNVNNKFWNWLFEVKRPSTKIISHTNLPNQSLEEQQEKLIEPMTKREVMLRYSSVWKTIIFFCLPTVILMLVQGLYNILDKSLALQFATPHAIKNWKYIELMIIGDGQGNHSILADFLQTNTHEQAVNKLFGPLNSGDYSKVLNIIKSYDPQDPYLAFEQLKEISSLTINEELMKKYINITTQYTAQTYNLAYSFNQIMAIGAGMVFAIEFGRGNKRELGKISGNGLTYSFLVSLFVGALLFSLSFRPWGQVLISSQMGNHKNLIIEELAWRDVEPLIYGIWVLFMANFCMNMVRSEGKMVHIMIMTISSLGVKCVVSIFSMDILGWELTGAQLGTVMAYFYQLVYCLIVIFFSKITYSNFSFRDLYILNPKNFTETIKAGVPNFVIYFAVFINAYVATSLVVQLPIPNGYPSIEDSGGTSIVQQLISSMTPWNEFILSAVIGLNQGVRTIIAFNYGAGNNKRILDILRKSSWLMFGWFMFIFVLIIVAGPWMLTMFAFPSEHVGYGTTFYWYQFVNFMTYPLACLTYISLGLFQGTKRSKVATWCTSLRTMTILLPMIGIGFAVSKSTNNAFWFFFFSGLTDLIVAILIAPLLYVFYKRTKINGKLVTREDSEDIKASYALYLQNQGVK